MTKSELIRCLSERFPALTAADAEAAVNLILEHIAERLSSGEEIEILDFGRLALDCTSPSESHDSADTTVVPATTKSHKYRLDELLAQCDPDVTPPRVPGWEDVVPAGKETL